MTALGQTGIWRARQLGILEGSCSRWKVLSLKCKWSLTGEGGSKHLAEHSTQSGQN